VDAALATCASQPSFLPVTTGPRLRQQTYVSGNISGVNPSKQLLSEAHALFGGTRRLSSFLSLGPGPVDILSLCPSEAKEEKELLNLLEAAVIDHKKLEQEVATKLGDSGVYFRFSAEHFLRGDQIKSYIGYITTQTNDYLRDAEISRKIDNFVERCRLNQGILALEQLGTLS
jgi:hypothetical protein